MARFVKEFYTDRMTFRKIDGNFLKDFILRLIDYTPAYHYKSKEGKRLGNNTIVAVYSVLRSVDSQGSGNPQTSVVSQRTPYLCHNDAHFGC